MGQYGPGTVKTIARGPFKFVVGADDNKRRPESIYIRQSCWVSPQMNTKAFIGSYDPEDQEDMMDLATQVGRKYDSLVASWGHRQFINILDKNYFDTVEDKPIVTQSFAWTRMEIGKNVFLEVEYYCITVNSMDYKTGEPTPSRTGVA
jgi:hypothetical protein